MSPAKRLREIAEIKRLLTLRSDLQRRLITMESRRVALLWKARLQQARPLAFLGKPLAVAAAVGGGVFLARRWRTVVRWIPQALTAWRFLSPVLRRIRS